MAKKVKDLDALIRECRPGYTLSEIAFEAGINFVTLWALRRGRVARPHPETLRGLAETLGISREEVFAAVDASRG